MRRRRKKRHLLVAPEPAPGVLVPPPEAHATTLRVMAYGPDSFVEETVHDVEHLGALARQWPVTWINVDGLRDIQLIERVGAIFGLHRLAVEDAVHVHQRAKVEQYPTHLFIVARMSHWNGQLETEQVSLFLGEGFVISCQEGLPGDAFDPVRERIRKGTGLMRFSGADYLTYALLDGVIDGYFPLLEELGERLEQLEDEILASPRPAAVARLHAMKRDLLTLRRAVWPLREATSSLMRDANRLIGDETRVHLRDCYDHTVRIIDFIETDRELSSDLMDLYLSSINQRMTEVMKVLTIIATVFIPLTFISSIYGMNFDTSRSPWNMPELEWYFGYPFALALMGATALGLVAYFRWKGWLGGDKGGDPDHP